MNFMTIRKTMLVAVFFLVAIFVLPKQGKALLIARDCNYYSQNYVQGNAFIDSSSHSYANGLLNYHFAFNPQVEERTLTIRGRYQDAETCGHITDPVNAANLDIPATVNNLSIRFITGGVYQLYDDDTGSALTCQGCKVHMDAAVPIPPGQHRAWFELLMHNGEWLYSSTSEMVQEIPPAPTQAARSPVLIIPGVIATELKSGEELLWLDHTRLLNPFGSKQFLDKLAFNSTMEPIEPNIFLNGVIRKKSLLRFNFDYTDGLIKEFEAAGYEEGKDLFLFPYDWRFGVAYNAGLLAQKINELQQSISADKFNVVAHSTGGLVLKKYVMDTADHHIDRVVLVGVPHLGAPKAIKVLLTGDSMDIPGLPQEKMRALAQNFPMIYDLSSSHEYVLQHGSVYELLTRNNFLQTKREPLDYINMVNYLWLKKQLNSNGFDSAARLHSPALDSFKMSEHGVQAFNVVGCRSGTISKIVERSSSPAIPLFNGLRPEFGPGDGTVPLNSAQVGSGPMVYALNATHAKMLSQEGIKQYIVSTISEEDNSLPKNLTENKNLCVLNGKILGIFSPVNVEAIDAQGNRTGLLPDGSIENNIPNAELAVFGEQKFLYLPDEAEIPAVNLTGSGNGTFSLSLSQVKGSKVVSTSAYYHLPVTPQLKGTLSLSSPTLNLDNDGNGTVDQKLKPEVVLPAGAEKDIDPPVTTISVQGKLGAPGFYRSDVTLGFKTGDTDLEKHTNTPSGVLKTYFQVNNALPQVYLGKSVLISEQGRHKIQYWSVDRAGNEEGRQELNFVVDKIAPDIEIQFNVAKQDLEFFGSDKFSTPVKLIDEGNLVTATDQAGNTTTLVWQQKDRKRSFGAELKEIRYNNLAQEMKELRLRFAWRYAGNLQLVSLDQQIRARQEFHIFARFEHLFTTLIGQNQKGSFYDRFSGLKLVRITVGPGGLTWQ
jgi:hypothetical protein